MKIVKFLSSYILKYRIKFALYIVFTFLLSIIVIVMPYLTGVYIDRLMIADNVKYIFELAISIGLLNAVNLFLRYKSDLIHTKLNTNVAFDISSKLYEHIKKLPLSYFQSIDSVYLSNRIIEDSNNIIIFFTTNVVTLFIELLKVIVSIIILFKINKLIALVTIIIIPIFTVIYNIFKVRIYNTTKDFKEKQNMFFSKVAEQFFSIKFIKINSIYEDMRKRLRSKFDTLFASIVKYYRLNYLFSNLGDSISIIMNIFLLLYGGYLVISKIITIGDFTIINTYFTMILNSTLFFLTLGKSYQNTLISYDRLVELLDIKEEHNGSVCSANIDQIDIRNLTVSYGSEHTIINGLNYSFTKGNIYIVKGRNGAGKSTLINTIAGLNNNLYEGEIRFGVHNIADLDMEYMRRSHMGFLIQEQNLLSSTIIDNITIGVDSVSEKESIMYWCDKLNLENKITSLEDGLESKISEGNSNFSGGEKQKISLIRLFLKNPELIIMDEPTSALDSISRQALIQTMKDIKQDHIIIIVTHDKELIEIADQVIDLDSTVYE